MHDSKESDKQHANRLKRYRLQLTFSLQIALHYVITHPLISKNTVLVHAILKLLVMHKSTHRYGTENTDVALMKISTGEQRSCIWPSVKCHVVAGHLPEHTSLRMRVGVR